MLKKKEKFQFYKLLFGVVFFLAPLSSYSLIFAYTSPSLPLTTVDVSYNLPNGNIILVKAGDDLQKAINLAKNGDVLRLEAGATFTGNFILPKKDGNSFIYIETSKIDSIKKPGERVSRADSSLMPKIVSPNTMPAIRTEAGARNYRFVGIEITTIWDKTTGTNTNLIYISAPTQTNLGDVPENIIFDRCYIHGTQTGNVRRGVAMHGKSIAVVDSYLSLFHEVGADAQAISGTNGPGPFLISNNYLEASGENILFGGDDPKINGLIPSDIVISGNLVYKPLSWNKNDPSYAGIPWTVKNLFELKNARRVLVENNIFENNWIMGQSGIAILFTPRNQEGTAPWSGVSDVTFRNNMIINSEGGGVSVSANDDLHTSTNTQRILIENNLFKKISGRLFQLLVGNKNDPHGIDDLTINHNTGFVDKTFLSVGDNSSPESQNTNFTFTNNIVERTKPYGLIGANQSEGIGSINSYFKAGWVFKNNIIFGGKESIYPTGNFFPASLSDVGFQNPGGGDYELKSGSLFKNKATDTKDIGADIVSLKAMELKTRGGLTDGNIGSVNIPIPTPLPPPPSSSSTPLPQPTPIPSPVPSSIPSPVSNPLPSPAPTSAPTPAPSISGGSGGGGTPNYSYAFSPVAGTPTPVSQNIYSSVRFTKDLSFGMRGQEVRVLQNYLISKGYLAFGNNTGYFGPLTRNAVASFQKDNGIISTGYFGPLSRAKFIEINT
jgi:hypothetical protein